MKNIIKKNQLKPYIIICGAAVSNAGAESMTCIVVEKIRKKYPDCNIVLATTDKYIKNIQEIVMPYSFPTDDLCSVFPMDLLFKYNLYTGSNKKYSEIIKNSKMIIDISGYSFTTKFGINALYDYLFRLYIAHKYQIKYYIMPQSFGPIEYNNVKDRILCNYLIKKCFKYADIVYAREKSGYNLLKKNGVKNVKFCPDMVLLYEKDIKISTICKNTEPNNELFDKLKNGSKKVGIVPNQKIMEKTGNKTEYVNALFKSIEYLLKSDYNVYIIAHCSLDIHLCNTLYEPYKKSDNVHILTSDINSESFSEIVTDFDFIISSRYHAIVHAFRKSVPVVAFGWEDKYNDLMKIMKQDKYMIDCRSKQSIDEGLGVLIMMKDNFEHEKEKIKCTLEKVRSYYGKEIKKQY